MSETTHNPRRVAPNAVREDPPAPYHTSGRRTAWGAVLDQVRADGGAWHRVAEYQGENRVRQASSIRAWLKVAPVGRGFEYCTRRVTLPDGQKVCRLYARLVAAPSEQVPARPVDGVLTAAPGGVS